MKSRAGKRQREETGQKRKDHKKEDADARKGRNVGIHCVFPMICGSGGSKSRLAKAAGAEASGQMRDEKVHAVVARSTFPSQNVQNTPGSDHFLSCDVEKVHAASILLGDMPELKLSQGEQCSESVFYVGQAHLNASLELHCRKTMEIRTKNVRAGFKAGLEGLKAIKLEQNFGPQNVRSCCSNQLRPAINALMPHSFCKQL